MQPGSQRPQLRKHSFQSVKKVKIEEPIYEKLKKIEIFYRYRIGQMYRQMRIPIYEKLLQEKKPKANRITKPQVNAKGKGASNENEAIQSLYKFVSLNSKYHHRQKLRFQRTPLLKYIEYDFKGLAEKSKTKQFSSIYDDLVQSDDEQKGQQNKKENQKDPQFSQSTINTYKKKNNISGRIVIAQGYDDLKARLISKYGWAENKDSDSLVYDLKYLSKKKDIDYVNLLDGQIVNHFNENKSITAKFGLSRNIRNIVSLGKDHNDFFPRCYDINDVKELEDFYEDFKFTHAKRIIEDYLLKDGNVNQNQEKIVQLALKCLELQNIPIQKKINSIANASAIYISLEQWKIIFTYQFTIKQNQKATKNIKLFEAVQQCKKICQKSDPQYSLNKQNIWIVKPASMSRGRGIKTFNDLKQILDYVIGKEISWVVQKYIERPLIIRKKKFDIRQWVLVTDFKPFRVWAYDECYIRFCADVYKPENLKDRKVHLTNNSVTKGVNNVQDGILENMMSQNEFAEELKFLQGGKEIFETIIKPQIQKIAIESLQSVKQNIVSRKNTLEVFGYDFMIDQNYKVWLIEVNSSPTMEYSTETTIKIVKKGMSDLADLIENYMLKGKQYNKENAESLYGGWRLMTNL